MGRSVLLLTLGMFVVVTIIQISINNRLQQLTQRNIDYHSENQAKNITASLMDYAINEIWKDQNWKGANNNGFSSQQLLGGEGDVKVYDMNDFLDPNTDIPPNSVPSWNQFTRLVYATAEYNNHTVATEVMLTQNSFSRYSYFTHQEPSGTYFFTGDVLTGPVHSNDRFNMAGTPIFYGKVTTAAEDYYEYPYLYTNPQFFEGINYNVAEIPLPTDAQLNQLRYSAQNGGRKYNNPIRVELLASGQAKVIEQTYGNNTIEHYINISDFNGVISSSEEVKIKGELKGQLTVHSEKNIEIIGDLTYVDDPRIVENSLDLLGLVSERNVIIDDDAHRDSGYSDVDIHASIMALEKSFTVEDYNEGSPRGVINLLGGIIQERRGPVGQFKNGVSSSGYDKNYVYDERLMVINPPSFPRESFFNIFYWKDRLIASS